MGLKWLLFPMCALLVGILKYVMSMRWLAIPNQGHSCFPHNFWSSYKHLIHYQSEGSCTHLVVIYRSPPKYLVGNKIIEYFMINCPLTLFFSFTKVAITLATYPGSAAVLPEPLGVVLIISPWNFPFRKLSFV